MNLTLLKSLSIGLIALNIAGANVASAKEYKHPVPSDNEVIYKFGTAFERGLPKRMNILVWNLHKGSNDTFPTEFIDLGWRRDLLINQEMFLDLNMRTVFGSFPMNQYVTATSFFMGKAMTRTGVSTGSEVPAAETKYVRTETLEPVVNSPKVTLITRYPIRGSKNLLTVVNIHGINFVDNDSFRKEIGRIYEVIKTYPSPLIFTGDFNSWNEERNEVLKVFTTKLNLSEASFIPDHRMRFNGNPLDHFYFTSDLKVLTAKATDFYHGSDHKPLELIVDYVPRTIK